MPAIQPAKLKVQIAELKGIYQTPELFIRKLIDLLEFYSDRTRRQGVVTSSAMLLNSLGVPKPVIRHLLIDIKPAVLENQEATFNICDRLWMEPYLEYRIIAASLLGSLPYSRKQDVLARVSEWRAGPFDEYSARILLEHGLSTMIRENPTELYKIAEHWLTSMVPAENQYAVLLIDTLVNNSNFENFPLVVRLITPYLRKIPQVFRYLLPSLVKSLIAKNPYETAFILDEALLASENQDTAWIIRQTIDQFPEDLQRQLRISLRQTQSIDGKKQE